MKTNLNKKLNFLELFSKGMDLYLKNFKVLTIPLLFPVLGQTLGPVLILAPVFYYLNFLKANPNSIDPVQTIIFLIAMIIPGFVIFFKAFWKYMIRMISLNTMTADILDNGEVKEMEWHDVDASARMKDYIPILLIMSLIWLVPMLLVYNPFLIFVSSCIAVILSVYLSLSFQILAFEDHSSIATLKRSCKLVSKNLVQTSLLGLLLFIITGVVAPVIFKSSVDIFSLTNILASSLSKTLSSLISEETLKIISTSSLSINVISKEIVSSGLIMTVSMFMLPLISACYTLLYRNALNRK